MQHQHSSTQTLTKSSEIVILLIKETYNLQGLHKNFNNIILKQSHNLTLTKNLLEHTINLQKCRNLYLKLLLSHR